MSNLMKFVMTIITLALLSFLNSEESRHKHGATRGSLVISHEQKLSV